MSIIWRLLLYDLFILFGQVTTAASAAVDPTCDMSTHDDTTMSAIQTALAVLMEGSSSAAKLPFITPITSRILQALTMRDAGSIRWPLVAL